MPDFCEDLLMATVLLLNGPNLNLLGSREPDTYGNDTLSKIEADLKVQLHQAKIELLTMQSNAEHELVDRIQQASSENIDLILLNPAAYTHTSVAIRDALLAVAIPFIEVHLSNPHSREPFRKNSFFSDIAFGVICGFGAQSYRLAADAAIEFINQQNAERIH